MHWNITLYFMLRFIKHENFKTERASVAFPPTDQWEIE